MIRLKNVSKIYKNGLNELMALCNINLSINSGEFVSIMGTSGSGKSTLLNIIGNMDNPSSGEYWLNERRVSLLNNNELSKIRNAETSFIFQHFALMSEYNVFENVELPLLRRKISKKEKKIIINSTLESLGIGEVSKKYPTELSGGQQQRVAIARALVSGSKIILADEPTGALDNDTSISILELMKKLNEEGITIIMVTHDEIVSSYAKRIIKIEGGKIIEDFEK